MSAVPPVSDAPLSRATASRAPLSRPVSRAAGHSGPVSQSAVSSTSGGSRRASEALMLRAVELGELVRGTTAPNPWVGAVLVTLGASTFVGATQPPPGRHAEIVALEAAREASAETTGATLFTTLEPCSHTGRTPPCAEAIVAAGIKQVFIGVVDPDPNVSGRGIKVLEAAGVEVTSGVAAREVEASLRPYLHQRRSGRPWVVLKLAATLDGRTGAPDGTSQWITSPSARADAHALRARCDAVLVGAGTVRADDPRLTVRDLPLHDPRRKLLDGREAPEASGETAARGYQVATGAQLETSNQLISAGASARLDPRRYVLGEASPQAKVRPCTELSGPLPEILSQLAADGVVELLVEGGPQVAGDFHRAGLVDEYVVYLAPAFMGGEDGLPLLSGAGAPSIDALWRGQITDVSLVGPDLRVTARPADRSGAHRCRSATGSGGTGSGKTVSGETGAGETGRGTVGADSHPADTQQSGTQQSGAQQKDADVHRTR